MSLPSDVDFEILDREKYRLVWLLKKLDFVANGIKPVVGRLLPWPSSFSSSFDKSATARRGPHEWHPLVGAVQIKNRVHYNRDFPEIGEFCHDASTSVGLCREGTPATRQYTGLQCDLFDLLPVVHEFIFREFWQCVRAVVDFPMKVAVFGHCSSNSQLTYQWEECVS